MGYYDDFGAVLHRTLVKAALGSFPRCNGLLYIALQEKKLEAGSSLDFPGFDYQIQGLLFRGNRDLVSLAREDSQAQETSEGDEKPRSYVCRLPSQTSG